MGRAIFTDVLCNMPEELTKEIRFFAKYMEQWIKVRHRSGQLGGLSVVGMLGGFVMLTSARRTPCFLLGGWQSALDGYSDALIERKLVRVRAFAHALRRYTSLNHLAQVKKV